MTPTELKAYAAGLAAGKLSAEEELTILRDAVERLDDATVHIPSVWYPDTDTYPGYSPNTWICSPAPSKDEEARLWDNTLQDGLAGL